MNFFPAQFSALETEAFVGAWESPDATDALEASHPGLRTRKDEKRLYCWYPEDAEGEPPPGFTRVTVRADEVPGLFKRLLLDGVGKKMTELGFENRRGWWVNFDAKNLLAEVPLLAGTGDDIGLYARIGIDVLFTRTADNRLIFGLVVDVLYTTKIDLTLDEWVAAGLGEQVIGTYVVLDERAPEAVRYPQHAGRVVGRVSGLRSSTCVLDDLREPALAELPLTSARPEPDRDNLHAYLEKRYEAAFTKGSMALAYKLKDFVRAKSRYKNSRGLVLTRLQTVDATSRLALVGKLTVRFDDMITCGPSTFPYRRLLGPTYSFDRAAQKFDTRVDRGLQVHGPYDRHVLAKQSHRILVLAQERWQGEVPNAINKLLNGVSATREVFTGLKAMYKQPLVETTVTFVKGDSMQHYADGFTRAVSQAPERPGRSKFDLVLTVLSQDHRLLADSENPYFQTKALALVNEGIPTQAITIEKLRSDDSNLQYILNTMCVAIYAKLGGTSHVLKLSDDPTAPTELVFGVGRSVVKHRRFGERTNTVGFATVFRANGEYLFNTSTPYCDDDSYERVFEETIRKTVEAVAEFEQLERGAPLRLVFHVPRRPGQHEVRAVLNAVGKLPLFKVEFALVHINDDHRLQMFDLDNEHPRTRSGVKETAGLLPARGLAVELGPLERLVTFIGPDEYKGNGTPSPLRVSLDDRSTFRGLDYLVQQLYQLSFMRASSLTPGAAPVSVAYAERLAFLAGRLRGVQRWTVELIQQRLGRKLWFV